MGRVWKRYQPDSGLVSRILDKSERNSGWQEFFRYKPFMEYSLNYQIECYDCILLV